MNGRCDDPIGVSKIGGASNIDDDHRYVETEPCIEITWRN